MPRPAIAIAAAPVAATGLIHLYLYFDYFHRVHTVSALFLANCATGLAIAAAMLLRPGWVAAAAGAAFCTATLAAFLVSVRFGLFGYHESLTGNWQEIAAAIELAGVAGCLTAARFSRPS